MFVFRSTYLKAVAEADFERDRAVKLQVELYEANCKIFQMGESHIQAVCDFQKEIKRLRQQITKLKAELTKARKNDHRDSKGRFTKGR